MMVGDMPVGKDYFATTVPTIQVLQDAVIAFQSQQAIVLNERMSAMLRFGEEKELYNRNIRPEQVVREKRRIDDTEEVLHRLSLLWTTAKSIIYLMSSKDSKGNRHFPALRMKIPYASALVLSMVGNEMGDIDSEGMMTLAAFTEFYGYLRAWNAPDI